MGDKAPVRFRPAELVYGILDYIRDVELADQPAPEWNEIVEHFTSAAIEWKTVENTMFDLIQFGALHRIGKPPAGRRIRDSRALKTTDLGRAWIDQELEPLLDVEDG